MDKYILALDQGTTSSRSILFDSQARKVTSSQQDFPQYTPKESWVEHNAEEIWNSQLQTVRNVLSGTDPASVAALGITNQRETTVLWDRHNGKPAGPAIVWQCRRSQDICDQYREHEQMIRQRTGLVLDPYFSATKIRWMLNQNPELERKAENGDLLFGTIDTWLVWKLTGGAVHTTDVSNASRTMLMNLETGQWDPQLLKLFGIPAAMLPEIRPSSGFTGTTAKDILGMEIPITGIAGDQPTALFGHRAFENGDVKNTYGTGCFMLMNTGSRIVQSPGGLLTTVAWGLDDKITYALEGSVFMAGAVLQWLRDDLELVDNVQEIDRLSESIDDTGGVYLVPAYQGLGTPWWDSSARGVLSGLTRASKKAQICRAFLESIAYRSRDVIDVMTADSGFSLNSLRVDGGVTNSDILMTFQAGLLGIPVKRPSFVEMTALGAALLAGLGAGIWESPQQLLDLPSEDTVFSPQMSEEERQSLYSGWLNAVGRVVQK